MIPTTDFTDDSDLIFSIRAIRAIRGCPGLIAALLRRTSCAFRGNRIPGSARVAMLI